MAPLPQTALVCVAAGAGTRMRAHTKKPFLALAGEPIICHTLRRFAAIDAIVECVLVVPAADRAALQAAFGAQLAALGVTRVVQGGARRCDSVAAGVRAVEADVGLIAVHDGVRPLVTEAEIAACLRAAAQPGIGGALLATPAVATIKLAADPGEDSSAAGDSTLPIVEATVTPRARLYAAQTPQVIRAPLLRLALARWETDGRPPLTDDVAWVERLDAAERAPIVLVPGSRQNLKITAPDDLALASFWLQRDRQHRD